MIPTYHHFVFRNPAVGGEILQHGHEELQAAIPVAQQQHHANQVHYTHHSAGQVVGHVENLKERKNRIEIAIVAAQRQYAAGHI